MTLGMPVLVVAATAAPESVPPHAGTVTCDVAALREAATRLMHEPDLARAQGRAAREHALSRFGLARFHRDWDLLMEELTT